MSLGIGTTVCMCGCTPAELPAPGRADTIRDLPDAQRAARLQRVSELMWQQIPRLPTDGWPQGLFGRSDPAPPLLAAGAPLQQIARLRTGRHLWLEKHRHQSPKVTAKAPDGWETP